MLYILNCDRDQDQQTNLGAYLHRLIPHSKIIDSYNNERSPIDECSGAIITGSWASLSDQDEWIATLKAQVRGIIEADIPILGICFGMQVLANILGGEVSYDQVNRYQFDWVALSDDELFRGLPKKLMAYQYHSDIVETMPPESRAIAMNSTALQGFRTRNIWAVQFHPEIDVPLAETMARRDKKSTRAVRNGLDKKYSMPQQIILNFWELCQANH